MILNVSKLFWVLNISREVYILLYLSKWTYYTQIFPLTTINFAQLNKIIGYFLWRGNILRVAPPILHFSQSQGDLIFLKIISNYKGMHWDCIEQSNLLSSPRFIFARQAFRRILHEITTNILLNITRCRHIAPYLNNTFITITYALAAQKCIVDMNIRQLYQYFMNESPPPLFMQHLPSIHWATVWLDLCDLSNQPMLHNLYFQIIYQILYMKTSLCIYQGFEMYTLETRRHFFID